MFNSDRLTVMAALAGALVATTGTARADNFAEGIIGMVAPMSDDDYDRAVDTSFKLGVRVGGMSDRDGPIGLGFELGGDWTILSSDFDTSVTDESFHRVRGLAGVRVTHALGDKGLLTARFAAGIDWVRASVSGTVLGIDFETTESDLGIALDPSIALQAQVSGALFGVQIGVPIGIHDDEPEDLDLDYTSVDLDILFVVRTGL